MKVIGDIRLFRSADGGRPAEFAGQPLNIHVRRIVMKLREQKFSLGEFDHLYLNFTPDRPEETIELNTAVDRYHPWYRYCDVGVSRAVYARLEQADCTGLICDRIGAALRQLFCGEAGAEEAVAQALSAAAEGERMRMCFKEKRTAKATATLYLRLLNNGRYLPLLCVTDPEGNELLCRDLPQTEDLDPLGEIRLSGKRVTVYPRRNEFARNRRPLSFALPE